MLQLALCQSLRQHLFTLRSWRKLGSQLRWSVILLCHHQGLPSRNTYEQPCHRTTIVCFPKTLLTLHWVSTPPAVGQLHIAQSNVRVRIQLKSEGRRDFWMLECVSVWYCILRGLKIGLEGIFKRLPHPPFAKGLNKLHLSHS